MIKKVDKNTSFSETKVFEYNGKTMDFRVPRVMGIVNVTPDSFYDDRTVGHYDYRAEQLVNEGAYIIDIGAVSTRQGAPEVSVEEEKSRVLPVLKEVRKSFPEIII